MSKVTDFEELETLDGTEIFYVVKDGVDYQMSIEKIKALIKENEQVIIGNLNW